MKKFFNTIGYLLSIYILVVMPYSIGVYLRQIQMGVVSNLDTFFVFFYMVYVPVILLSSSFERDIVNTFRSVKMISIKDNKLFWLKIYLLDTIVLQLLLGFLNEKAFPGFRSLPLAGEEIYWIMGGILLFLSIVLAFVITKQTLKTLDTLMKKLQPTVVSK